MSEEIRKNRSPSAPRVTLESAIESIRKLYGRAGKSALKPEVAVQALGYAGLNGAALGILASLKQYGLLAGERGESVAVSPLAIRLIHPTGPAQEDAARREAALSPKVFAELASSGYSACAEDVLANHLRQSGFTSDGADRAASVFKQNEEFAKLSGTRINETVNLAPPIPSSDKSPHVPIYLDVDLSGVDARPPLSNPPLSKGLRYLPIPLDIGDAPIPVGMSEDDFELLIDTLKLWKKKIVARKSLAQQCDETAPAPRGEDMPSTNPNDY